MRMLTRLVVLGSIMILGSLASAQAAPITWRFAGSMDNGTLFSGGLTYEDTLVPDPIDMDYNRIVLAEYAHPHPLYSLFVNIDGLELMGGRWDRHSIGVFNDVPWENGNDRVGIYARVSAELESLSLGSVSLLFVDAQGTWLPGIFPLSVLSAPDVSSLTMGQILICAHRGQRPIRPD